MVIQTGEVPFEEAFVSCIPVDIWLVENENSETGVKDGTWTLRAASYLPHKSSITENTFIATSENRDDLVQLLKTYVIPLYEAASKKLQAICDGKTDRLYKWDE